MHHYSSPNLSQRLQTLPHDITTSTLEIIYTYIILTGAGFPYSWTLSLTGLKNGITGLALSKYGEGAKYTTMEEFLRSADNVTRNFSKCVMN